MDHITLVDLKCVDCVDMMRIRRSNSFIAITAEIRIKNNEKALQKKLVKKEGYRDSEALLVGNSYK